MENEIIDNLLFERYVSLKKNLGKITKRILGGSEVDLSQAEKIIIMKLEPGTEINLSKLSELTGLSNTMITFMIDSLEKKGYVERVRGIDRRIYYAKLTKDGEIKYNELKKEIRKVLIDLFNKLSEDEKTEFLESIEKIDSLLNKILY